MKKKPAILAPSFRIRPERLQAIRRHCQGRTTVSDWLREAVHEHGKKTIKNWSEVLARKLL